MKPEIEGVSFKLFSVLDAEGEVLRLHAGSAIEALHEVRRYYPQARAAILAQPEEWRPGEKGAA